MKLFLALAVALAAPSAFAQEGGGGVITPLASGDTLTFNLTAQVGDVCGVFSTANASSVSSFDVDFGDLGELSTSQSREATFDAGGVSASLTYACNLPGGFTRTISSENSGVMVHEDLPGGTGNTIAYEMQHSGNHDLDFTYTQLTTPIVTTHMNDAFLDGEAGSVSFRASGVTVDTGVDVDTAPYTTAYAGDYADIVTIAITTN